MMNDKNSRKPKKQTSEQQQEIYQEGDAIINQLADEFYKNNLAKLDQISKIFESKYHNKASRILILGYCNAIMKILGEITGQLQDLQHYKSSKPDEKIDVA